MKKVFSLAVLVAALAAATWTSAPRAATWVSAVAPRACVPEPIWGYYDCSFTASTGIRCYGIVGWYNPCG